VIDDQDVAQLTLFATVANLQVNLEILEVSKQILKANLDRLEVERRIDERTIQCNT